MVAIGTPGDTIGFRGSNDSMVLLCDTGRCVRERTKRFGVAELMKMKMDKITLDAGLFNDLLATAKILHQKADGVNPDFLKSSGRVIAECERVLEEANHQNNIFLAQQLIDDLAQQDETSHGKSPL
jgi:hypothetical protein